jgi:sortase A
MIVLALGLAAWGGWRGAAANGSRLTSVAELPRAALEATAADALPKAMETPSVRPSATPSATASRTRIVPTPRPTQTLTPSVIPSPTATPTPIHAPAAGPPTRITIPKLDLDSPVVNVGIIERYVDGVLHREWAVADGAAGFHEGMAWPGQVGNTVLSGHNNIRGEVFRDIHQLAPGNDVFVWVGENGYRYTVSTVVRLPIKGAPADVLEDNLKWIQPTADQRLTLVTCWPPWSNTHRTIVVAYPAPWSEP